MTQRPQGQLARTLFARLRPRLDPRIKDSVVRRLTQRVALLVLGQHLSAWEPVHSRAILLADQAESLPVDTLHRLFEELCGVLISGQVVSVQEVRRAVLEARTCPGPEVDRGCLLFNYHHFSDNPHILRTSPQQRCDDQGRPVTCDRFEARQGKPCYGCGCVDEEQPAHGLVDPRPGPKNW